MVVVGKPQEKEGRAIKEKEGKEVPTFKMIRDPLPYQPSLLKRV